MNMRKLIYAAIFCTLLSATCKQTVKDEPGGEYGWKWGDSSSAAWNSDTDSKRNEPPYQPSHASLWDLKHTDLKVRFNFDVRKLYGTAKITLTLRFYPTDSVVLDAKHLDIESVTLIVPGKSQKLNFDYRDSMKLIVHLPETKNRINGAQPTEINLEIVYSTNTYSAQVQEGLDAIEEDRGLYFINHDLADPNLPRQIWTQGETESSSRWFPTIDAPNQKSTQVIAMTVPDSMVTLSNGLKTASTKNADGSRTDVWEQKLPHAPYLFMMAVGNWAIVKDKWNGKEVSYLLEKPYEPFAKLIFGKTPQMIEFFSNYTGVPFPWEKYSQVVVRNFVSGAMENTSATVHMEQLQHTPRQHIDRTFEDYISHELFHQWFGDLVTAESWSNITLNESFATYGEYLWAEHHYGKDKADELLAEFRDYALFSEKYSPGKTLIRHHYNHPTEVFDGISYQKGAAILHMLRKVVGDDAFRAAINLYLTSNAYKSAEVAQLRMAFEQVTGQDYNWFFNQWYNTAGYPVIKVSPSPTVLDSGWYLSIDQEQSNNIIYRLPVKIKYAVNGKVFEKSFIVDQANSLFNFDSKVKPDWYIFDSENSLLGTINYSGFYTWDGNQSYENELYRYEEEFNTINSLISAIKATTDKGLKHSLLLSLEEYSSNERHRQLLKPFYNEWLKTETHNPTVNELISQSEDWYKEDTLGLDEYKQILNSVLNNTAIESSNRMTALNMLNNIFNSYSKSDYTSSEWFRYTSDSSAALSTLAITYLPAENESYLNYAREKGIIEPEISVRTAWYKYILKADTGTDNQIKLITLSLNQPGGSLVFSKLTLSWLYSKVFASSKSDHSEAVYAVNRLFQQIKSNKVALKCLAVHCNNLLENYLNDDPDDVTPHYKELKNLFKEISNAARQ